PNAATATKPAGGVVACGAAAPAGGNGGATDIGVSDTTIKVGGTFFNGGFLDKYSQVSQNAASAYFNFINSQGGICGRKIAYSPCDTAGTADGTSGCLTKLAAQDKVFMMGPSLDFNLDIVQKTLDDYKLPWVGSSGLYDQEFTSPWMYPTQIPGGSVGALIASHAVNVLKVKRIGVSQLRNGAGPSCTGKVKSTAEALGGTLVQVALNSDVETSLDSQVAALKNANVEAVLFCNDPVNTVKFIQAAQRTGWHPVFFGGFVAADDVPKAAGAYGKGMYGLTMFDFYNSTSPGLTEYKKITEFYYPNTFHHFYEQAAYAGAAAIVAALKAMGPKVTRTDFLKQLKTMRAFDIGLGLKLDFGNLKNAQPSGIILKADDALAWQIESKRFSPATAKSSISSSVQPEIVGDRGRARVAPARTF
ncbi:ABC transporter substrate-binding protein, partial [Sporichthya sp.]|uniref:ABC transporter substrate-binding protein n=1 Tax=Sporichthya sp. TaxID=65475 RepID=UPI0025F46755